MEKFNPENQQKREAEEASAARRAEKITKKAEQSGDDSGKVSTMDVLHARALGLDQEEGPKAEKRAQTRAEQKKWAEGRDKNKFAGFISPEELPDGNVRVYNPFEDSYATFSKEEWEENSEKIKEERKKEYEIYSEGQRKLQRGRDEDYLSAVHGIKKSDPNYAELMAKLLDENEQLKKLNRQKEEKRNETLLERGFAQEFHDEGKDDFGSKWVLKYPEKNAQWLKDHPGEKG